MSLQIEASDAVIEVLDKALRTIDRDLSNKVNIIGEDSSGPIVFPVVGTLRSATAYLKALRQGHAKKKAVRQLGKQLEKVDSCNDDNGECFRAVLALLKEKPQSSKEPRASQSKKAGTALRLVE